MMSTRRCSANPRGRELTPEKFIPVTCADSPGHTNLVNVTTRTLHCFTMVVLPPVGLATCIYPNPKPSHSPGTGCCDTDLPEEDVERLVGRQVEHDVLVAFHLPLVQTAQHLVALRHLNQTQQSSFLRRFNASMPPAPNSGV